MAQLFAGLQSGIQPPAEGVGAWTSLTASGLAPSVQVKAGKQHWTRSWEQKPVSSFASAHIFEFPFLLCNEESISFPAWLPVTPRRGVRVGVAVLICRGRWHLPTGQDAQPQGPGVGVEMRLAGSGTRQRMPPCSRRRSHPISWAPGHLYWP